MQDKTRLGGLWSDLQVIGVKGLFWIVDKDTTIIRRVG
jgi:hypothetical protein